ncbi:hypothetical protein H310_05390 [Aphanomyces invadans]|uniref:Chromate transporter n=1 Tax=Aphanomyces invadans TaxID=157072 RepID=A0A024U9T2_9STRA|nr:hypothetical protein H310_05390 [Aphanomyces invadans]ETW02945.1 hypothetical protein H310_05390 [Aphanomyces invadans]|eukprot:XP_008868329.1 hypothetical protein H310_05390 [Aphanomyces invadans]
MTKAEETTVLINKPTKPEILQHTEPYLKRLCSVITEVLPVALVSFGGPQAHLGLAHERFVERLQWLDDERYLEVLALGSALPGPTSTQVVSSVGLFRAGLLGGILAFLVWALPAFSVMTVAGLGAQHYLGAGLPSWMAGLAPAATSLVIIAAVKLWNKACGNDQVKMAIAAISACVVLATQNLGTWIFPALMVAGGVTTLLAPVFGYTKSFVKSSRDGVVNPLAPRDFGIPPWAGALIILVWATAFATLSYFDSINQLGRSYMGLFYAFFRIGSIIFGGGQVMLPMLLNDIVNAGWVTKDQFFIGFALIQSLPGPLFNMSAYLGAVALGVPGAFLAAFGLFGPGIGLFFAVLPLWELARTNHHLQVFMAGVNSAAIGLVVAAIGLLWQHAIHSHGEAAVCLATGALVGLFNVPAPVGILTGGLLGYGLFALNIAQSNYCATN